MKSEQEIKKEWNDKETEWLEHLAEHLRKHEYNTMDILGRSVAALCNISEKEMYTSLSEKSTQARQFFWFAYNYMTQLTHTEIAQKTSRFGVLYARQSVSQGIANAQERICKDEMWARRWAAIRTIIRLGKDQTTNEYENKEVVLSLKVPKNLRNMIKIEVKQ